VSQSTDATLLVGQQPDDPPEMPQIPEVRLERELGRGGMGAVWLGRQELLDRPVAVKVMLADGDAQFLARFKREARILATLAHPHIVTCYHAGVNERGLPYLVMEFVDGPNLREWIETHGPLSDRACLRLADEIADGLGHACAQGIIHRDVKPENILLAPCAESPDDFPWRAKVADLGLARPACCAEGSSLALTAAGAILGTPATMAPEQFDDPDTVDHRADIYGLGCILFHARCGEAAFAGRSLASMVASKVGGEVPDPQRLCGDIDRSLHRLILDCLAAARERRPGSWLQIRERLRQPAGNPAPLLPWLGAGFVGAALLLGALLLRGTQPPPEPVASADPPLLATVLPSPGPETALPRLNGDVPLFNDDYLIRLAGWTKDPGAQWDGDMDSAQPAATGINGAIHRPLPGLPCALTGQLELSPGCDGIFIGIDTADGGHAGLWILEIGGSSAYLGRWAALADPPLAQTGGWNGDGTDAFRLELEPGRIRAVFADREAAELALPAAPVAVRLHHVGGPAKARALVVDLRALPLAP
jgi:serine/threonine protein kinase